MPARNDSREGADPKAVSALDCFALMGLAMTASPDASPPVLPQFSRTKTQLAAQGIVAELRSVAMRSEAIGAESPTRRRRDAPILQMSDD
jgi:hypothetical protein